MKAVFLLFVYVMMIVNALFWIGIAVPKFITCDIISGECSLVLMVFLIFTLTPFVLFWLVRKLFRYILNRDEKNPGQDNPKIYAENAGRNNRGTGQGVTALNAPAKASADFPENNAGETDNKKGMIGQIFSAPAQARHQSAGYEKSKRIKKTGFFNEIFGPPR